MTKRYSAATAILLLLIGGSAVTARAQVEGTETRLVIRALAHDAKLIGTNVGGAHIVIREVRTGRILADGVHLGGTGNTGRIIDNPRVRHASLFDSDEAAGFSTTILLERPTLVDITIHAPLGDPDGAVQSSRRMLLIPGRHVEGDGIVIELNGLTLDWLAPDPDIPLATGSEGAIRVKVTMLCGCPTEPDGRWDANEIEVVARILSDGAVVREFPLAYAGERSTFQGSWLPESAGEYELEVLAMQDARANFGRISRTLTVGN